MSVSKVAAKEINSRISQGEKVMFVDTRPRANLPSHSEKLPGAVHVPHDEAAKHIADVNRDCTVVTYGEGPNEEEESVSVANLLKEHGFENVRFLGGGIQAWKQNGLPIERR